MYIRKQTFEGVEKESFFFWGARQTGKSTLLRQAYPDALWIDLLLYEEYERYSRNPTLLREILKAQPSIKTVVIDEIQRIPSLLNEIHWLIVNTKTQFIMSGSSPRKILREGHNLLGGRALRYELYPLVSAEIPDFDLLKALNHGLLPRHYDAGRAGKLLSAYIGSYLSDEIASEAKVRNIPSFHRFLEVAALTNGEIINYTNIATDTGVSTYHIKEYFQILEDTLIGRMLPSFQKRPKRRVIASPKFYYFDVGIANYLLNRSNIVPKTELFGKAFEHFIYQEIYAHSRYSDKQYPITYWRTASGFEIDLVLGAHEVAVEVKSTDNAQPRHLKGLYAFIEDYKVSKSIMVTNDTLPRKVGKIDILPWSIFLERLWADEII